MKLNKDGTAKWDKGDVVEINVMSEDHDPQRYYAKCLTTNVYPIVQVLNARYPDPLEGKETGSPYIIWRQVPEDEAKLVVGEDTLPEGVTYGMRLQPGGQIAIFDKRKKKQPVVETCDSVEEAEAWVARYECPNCGRPALEPANGCFGPHFGGAPKPFSF